MHIINTDNTNKYAWKWREKTNSFTFHDFDVVVGIFFRKIRTFLLPPACLPHFWGGKTDANQTIN